MAVGESIETNSPGVEEAKDDFIPRLYIPQTLDLHEKQRITVKRRRDGYLRRDGQILSIFPSQILIKPHDDPQFLMDIRPYQMESGESMLWVASISPDYLVPVATPRQSAEAKERKMEVFDFLRESGTGILHNRADIILC